MRALLDTTRATTRGNHWGSWLVGGDGDGDGEVEVVAEDSPDCGGRAPQNGSKQCSYSESVAVVASETESSSLRNSVNVRRGACWLIRSYSRRRDDLPMSLAAGGSCSSFSGPRARRSREERRDDCGDGCCSDSDGWSGWRVLC